ncbi:hypothetical protein [Vibrio splendidus]|uniref:hypothetical protein n=1 Tax=Vibrio splendidus TaxID=29497 RepID=UPI003D117D8F
MKNGYDFKSMIINFLGVLFALGLSYFLAVVLPEIEERQNLLDEQEEQVRVQKQIDYDEYQDNLYRAEAIRENDKNIIIEQMEDEYEKIISEFGITTEQINKAEFRSKHRKDEPFMTEGMFNFRFDSYSYHNLTPRSYISDRFSNMIIYHVDYQRLFGIKASEMLEVCESEKKCPDLLIEISKEVAKKTEEREEYERQVALRKEQDRIDLEKFKTKEAVEEARRLLELEKIAWEEGRAERMENMLINLQEELKTVKKALEQKECKND